MPKRPAFRGGSIAMKVPPVWLDLPVDDTAAAAKHLATQAVVRCREIEPPPQGFKGFRIVNPAGIVYLVADALEDPEL